MLCCTCADLALQCVGKNNLWAFYSFLTALFVHYIFMGACTVLRVVLGVL
jgi:hypothetical protein